MAEQEILALKVLTPRKVVLETHALDVTVPGAKGYVGFLPNHTSFLSTVSYGEIQYTTLNGEHKYLFVHGGFVEVGADHVTVLADKAEQPREIDVNRAKKALERAQRRISGQSDEEEIDMGRAQAALQRAVIRLDLSHRG